MPIGYHFTGATLRDGRPIPPIGEKLVHEGPVVICRSGLHGSDEPFHALNYAPGNLLHQVQAEETWEQAVYDEDGNVVGHKTCGIIRHDDKWVTGARTILATIDATHLLRRFAADQALGVAHLWDMPEVVREWAETMDESRRDAAYVAAYVAADAAADAAAYNAADAAAWAAARAAAEAAAYGAYTAVHAAASAAAEAAAYAAGCAAARHAARAAARADFNARVYAAFGVTK